MPLAIVYSPTPATLATVQLDAVTSKTHTADVDVTDHEVEVGADITDHAKPKPETLKLEALVSDGPLGSASPFKPTPGRTRDIVLALRAIKDASQIVTITHNGTTYENMVMTNLDVPDDVRSIDSAKISLQFKQVRTVTTRTVGVKKVPRTKVKKVPPEDKGGTQVPKPATPAQKRVSFWEKAKNKGFGGAAKDVLGLDGKSDGSLFGGMSKVPGISGGAPSG